MRTAIVQDIQDGALLTVHVQPKAARTESVGIHGDAFKIRVAAPPVDGAANEELIRFLALELSVARSSIAIDSGMGGRHKRVRVHGVTAEQVMDRLAPKESKAR